MDLLPSVDALEKERKAGITVSTLPSSKASSCLSSVTKPRMDTALSQMAKTKTAASKCYTQET
jgi:hypothetical protein